jgi:hypothetical protein
MDCNVYNLYILLCIYEKQKPEHNILDLYINMNFKYFSRKNTFVVFRG